MPHVITQVAPGTSEEQKKQLALEFSKAVANEFGVPEANISVGVEESSSKTPKVIVNLWPGRTKDKKDQVKKDFIEAVAETLGVKINSNSVKFKEIDPEKWIEKIFEPEIERKEHTLYKKQEYTREIYNSWLKKL